MGDNVGHMRTGIATVDHGQFDDAAIQRQGPRRIPSGVQPRLDKDVAWKDVPRS